MIHIIVKYKDQSQDCELPLDFTVHELRSMVALQFDLESSDLIFQNLPSGIALDTPLCALGITSGFELLVASRELDLSLSINTTDDDVMEVCSDDDSNSNGLVSPSNVRGSNVSKMDPEMVALVLGALEATFDSQPFEVAMTVARRERKLLLLILFSKHDQESISFVRDLLEEEVVMQHLAHYYVSWICETSESAKLMGMQAIIAQRVPQLGMALAGLHSGTQRLPLVAALSVDAHKLDIVMLENGYQSQDVFLARIFQTTETHSAPQARQTSTQSTGAAALIQQQDQELADSIAADRQKEMEARKRTVEQEEASQLEEALKLSAKQAVADHLQMLQERKRQNAAGVPPEPAKDTPGITHALFRLPDGSRIERIFPSSTDCTFSDVYKYLDASPPLADVDVYRYALITSFPKKRFTLEEHGHVSLRQANLIGQVAFFLQNPE